MELVTRSSLNLIARIPKLQMTTKEDREFITGNYNQLSLKNISLKNLMVELLKDKKMITIDKTSTMMSHVTRKMKMLTKNQQHSQIWLFSRSLSEIGLKKLLKALKSPNYEFLYLTETWLALDFSLSALLLNEHQIYWTNRKTTGKSKENIVDYQRWRKVNWVDIVLSSRRGTICEN